MDRLRSEGANKHTEDACQKLYSPLIRHLREKKKMKKSPTSGEKKRLILALAWEHRMMSECFEKHHNVGKQTKTRDPKLKELKSLQEFPEDTQTVTLTDHLWAKQMYNIKTAICT